MGRPGMANDKQPTVIKKYANRRLYNTGASTYVTLEDLAVMVKAGEDFVVYDAKTGEDITRPVLAQIIFEQEAKEGQSLLPITFLRQLIGFYGDSMQTLVPSYLEFSFDKFVAEQQKMREKFASAFGVTEAPGAQMFTAMEETARHTIALFSQALSAFNPFVAGAAAPTPTPAARQATEAADLEQLRKQVSEMQRNIESLSKKG